jgi:hypothetical protein
MTDRQKLALHEERLAIYERDNGICQHCGRPVNINQFEVAHRIANTVLNKKRFGKAIVDHPLNKAIAHPGGCNSGLNIGYRPADCAELVYRIKEAKHGK